MSDRDHETLAADEAILGRLSLLGDQRCFGDWQRCFGAWHQSNVDPPAGGGSRHVG
jgi:hypothetical protein